jgi:hypothetical protein
VRDLGNGEVSSPPGAAEKTFLGASTFPRKRSGVAPFAAMPALVPRIAVMARSHTAPTHTEEME